MAVGGACRHPRDMSEHTLHTPMSSVSSAAGATNGSPAFRGGLGRYFDINPAVFRLGFVVLTLLGGSGILVYIAAVLVMPKEGDEQLDRGGHPRRSAATTLRARRARPRRASRSSPSCATRQHLAERRARPGSCHRRRL